MSSGRFTTKSDINIDLFLGGGNGYSGEYASGGGGGGGGAGIVIIRNKR